MKADYSNVVQNSDASQRRYASRLNVVTKELLKVKLVGVRVLTTCHKSFFLRDLIESKGMLTQ